MLLAVSQAMYVSLLFESTGFVGKDEDIQQLNCFVVEQLREGGLIRRVAVKSLVAVAESRLTTFFLHHERYTFYIPRAPHYM